MSKNLYQNLFQESNGFIAKGFIVASAFSLALTASTSVVCSDLIEERVSKLKHLQYTTGVRPVTYWVSAFVWDFTIYCLTILIFIVVLIFMGEKYLIGQEVLPVFLSSLCAFGFSLLLLVYLESWSKFVK